MLNIVLGCINSVKRCFSMHSHCLKLFCREMLKYGIFCRKKKGFRTVSQKWQICAASRLTTHFIPLWLTVSWPPWLQKRVDTHWLYFLNLFILEYMKHILCDYIWCICVFFRLPTSPILPPLLSSLGQPFLPALIGEKDGDDDGDHHLQGRVFTSQLFCTFPDHHCVRRFL